MAPANALSTFGTPGTFGADSSAAVSGVNPAFVRSRRVSIRALRLLGEYLRDLLHLPPVPTSRPPDVGVAGGAKARDQEAHCHRD